MKVYQMRGKKPLDEIEYIKQLLGDLYQGHHAYVPEHTDQDTTIVLKAASQNMGQWLQQVADILTRDGYEVEAWG